MSLLKKIDTNFSFYKILEKGYSTHESLDTKAKIKYANGNRKRIYSDNEDVIIKIELGGLDAADAKDYIDNLTDGPYEYWSIAHQQYKKANFLVDKPELALEKFYNTNEYYLDDIEVVLEKSSDIV